MLRFRLANVNDEELLFHWRKDDEDNSWWQGEGVTRSGHSTWLDMMLVPHPLTKLYVVETARNPIGQVRIDSNGEISFSVDKRWRGQGYGAQMVKEATLRNCYNGGRIKANADRSNEAGIKTMLKADFKIREDVVFLRYPE